jgi:chloramphenicol 3-O phosphotransferase
VHEPGIYDFEVDTTHRSPEECAASIGALLDSGDEPAAFRELAAKGSDAPLRAE